MSVLNLFALDKQRTGARKPDVAAGATEEVAVPAIPQQTSPVGMPSQTMEQQQRQTAPAYNGGSNNAQAALDYLASAYTTPQREDEIRKASVMNQRIAAVADALRHIGNIYNTTQYAPSQQFNNPVQEEYTRYLQGKSVRDAANQRYLTYMQQKAAQDAQMDRFEKEQEYKNRMAAHYEDQDRRLWERDAETAAYHEGLLGLKRTQQQLKADLDNKKISVDEYNARSRRISALASQMRAEKAGGGRGGSGGGGMSDYEVLKENTLDENGRIVSSKTTRTVKRGGQTTTTTNTKNRTAASTPSTEQGGKQRRKGTNNSGFFNK